MTMNQDIDNALEGWEYKPGMVQARLVQAGNGRQIIQMRVDLGVLQIEASDRPDGTRPHGCPTYFEYLREQARISDRAGHAFVLSEEQCQEADREFMQFYHRRLCWLALRNFANAVDDADHTLAFMDFVRQHSPNAEFTQAHEQYRGLVLFQCTQARAALLAEQEKPEEAIDEILGGLEKLRMFFASYGLEEQWRDNGMVQQLRKIERTLRKRHKIDATLREQLSQAVANEEYEKAAKLRDALRERHPAEDSTL
jgi:hypothetical protein